MKKLLSLLATVSLVSTATASIVACGGNNGPIDEDNGDNINQNISTIISVTDLGDINFYSLTGNDVQTQTEIINQVRALNSSVGDAQINISNINPINGTATISVLGFSGSLQVTFTVLGAETAPIPVSFPSVPNSMVQLQDGTILVVGGTAVGNSFVASVDFSDPANPQATTLITGYFPSIPRSITQLEDGTILVVGGVVVGGTNPFLASFDLSNSQVQILAQGSTAFPAAPSSITQLQDGTILIVGGASAETSFLASVALDLSDPINSQVQILAQGLDALPATSQSMTQLQDGTILVVGGTAANGSTSFLSSVDLSNPVSPQVEIIAQGSTDAFPSSTNSIIQLQDGTILVAGGTNAGGGNSFVASVDLSNPASPQTQTVAQGSLPSAPNSIIQLQDGTILAVGGTATAGGNSFLRVI